MLPLGARRPQKPNLLPSLMDKGLMALRRVANRDCRAQELKLLCGKQCSLDSPAEAVNLYYRRLVRLSLLLEMGERKGVGVSPIALQTSVVIHQTGLFWECRQRRGPRAWKRGAPLP